MDGFDVRDSAVQSRGPYCLLINLNIICSPDNPFRLNFEYHIRRSGLPAIFIKPCMISTFFPSAQCIHLIKAHQFSEIGALQLSISRNSLLSVAHDGYLREWSLEDYSLLKQLWIGSPYLKSLISFQGSYLVGSGLGELVHVSASLEIIKRVPLHEDCITGIILVSHYLITCSFDGHLCFINPKSWEVQRRLKFDSEFEGICTKDGKVYLSGRRSYQVDVETGEATELKSFTCTLATDSDVLCCSDDKGIFSVTRKLKAYICCEHITLVGNQIVGLSEESLLFFKCKGSLIQWTIQCVKELKAIQAIRATVSLQNRLFVGLDSGNIIVFELSIENTLQVTEKGNRQF